MKNISLSFFRLSGRTILFKSLLGAYTSWQLKSLPEQEEMPSWKSNAGFDGWAKTIASEFGISKARAGVWLLNPETINEIDHLIDEDEAEEITSRSPFGESRHAMGMIAQWKKFVPWMSFKKWCYTWALVTCPMDRHDVAKIVRVTETLGYYVTAKQITDLPRWHMLSVAEIVSAICDIDVTMAKRVSNPSHISFLLSVGKHLDAKYWDGQIYVSSALKAGMDPAQLFDLVTDNKMTTLARKTKIAIINGRGANYIQTHMAGRTQKVEIGGWPITYKMVAPCDQLDSYIERYCSSLLVWEWASRHVNWVGKNRIVHGPGGRTDVLYNHQLLELVTEEHLPRGSKTSSEYVEECVKATAQARLEAKLYAQNVQLPKFKGKIKDDDRIEQILESDGLLAEGKTMNHCVGAYVDACVSGTSCIFHVEDGTRLGATVEVGLNPVRVLQAMNYGNSYSESAMKIMEGALGIRGTK